MKKSVVLIIIFCVVVILSAAALFVYNSNNKKSANNQNGIILFYSDDCFYCKNVEKYIEENKIEEKIEFERLEVQKNKNNAEILLEKANLCKIPNEEIGVPFLWDGKNCIVGEQPIIDFFKEKIKQ